MGSEVRRPLIGHSSSPELHAQGGTRLLGASALQQGTVITSSCVSLAPGL